MKDLGKEDDMTGLAKYVVADFQKINPVKCPCGEARRAFYDTQLFPGTIHQTTIDNTAKTHYHTRLTETYYILECNEGAFLELDDDAVPVRPGMCIVIPPGVRHRAVGKMTVIIIVLPKFDPDDEFVIDD